jgi:hypothetical protein
VSDIDPDVFDDAADLIERDGWWDGSQPGVRGSNCAYTAISRATLRLPAEADWTHATAFAKAQGLNTTHDLHGIPAWNDASTRQQVLDALRKTAKAYRS